MAYPSRAEPVSVARQSLLRRGLLLEALTVGWNVTEGIIAVAAGVAAGSAALISFGIDSFIETTSAIVVGWRLRLELRRGDPEQAEAIEHKAARVAGSLLLLLAIYIVADAGRRLFGFGSEAEKSHRHCPNGDLRRRDADRCVGEVARGDGTEQPGTPNRRL